MGSVRATIALSMLAGTAIAERPPPAALTTPAAPLPTARSWGEEFAARLTRLGETIDTHLASLTFDAVEFRVDGRARRARLSLHREGEILSFRWDSELGYRKGAAVIDNRFAIAVRGHELKLELPPIELVPRSYLGERYVEIRVPIVYRPW
jgi:hypothetical protein